MAFSVTTRALLVSAVAALAVLSSPAQGVDFEVTAISAVALADTPAAGPGTVSATTPAAATTADATATAAAPAAATPAAPGAAATTASSAASGTTASSGASAAASTTTTTSSSTLPTTVKKTVDGWPGAVVIKGNKFFDSKTGLEFRMKGMAYYPRPNAGEFSKVSNYDWAADEHESVWGPDLAIMQDLGVNTVRLYSVDPSKSHDKFMCAAAQAGIYVLIGMAAPCKDCALLDELPPKCYPDHLFERVQMVYNAFAVYDNVLGFSVGNENNLLRTYEKTGIQTMPCAKALLRDARSYAASCAASLREVPIGLDLADILPRDQWLSYMDCAVDKNEFTRAEWLGFNPYVECDQTKNTDYSKSAGLQNLMNVYSKIQYPRPLMFGEFGCNLGKNTMGEFENQRMFYDAKWMNEETEMTAEIVGGNVFEFVTEIPNTVAKKLTKVADEGRYGVGYFSPDTCDHDKVPCVFVPYPEYANLKKAYTSTKAPTLKMSDYKVAREAVLECPSNISATLQPMPTSIKPLSCRSGPDSQPKCNGASANSGTKAKTAPALGATVPPSNTNTPGAGGASGNSTSAAVAVGAPSFAAAAIAAVFSVVASIALV